MKIGQITDYVVHVRGVLHDRDDEHMLVGDHLLPARLGNGVVTLSSVWPDGERVRRVPCNRDHCGDGECDGAWECDRDHCEDGDCAPSRGLEQGHVIEAAQRAHDLVHPAPWAFCSDALCSAVRLAAALDSEGSLTAWQGNGRTNPPA